MLAYYLNPRYQYNNNISHNQELTNAVLEVFQKLEPNSDMGGEIGNEVTQQQ